MDGRIVTELGTKVDPRASRVEVDGERIVRQASVYLVLHKPRGVVSTMSDPEGRQTVRDLLGGVSATRFYPVGRLDFNTSGALLVTNDGDFSMALMHPKRAVPKTYVVKVQGMMEDRDVDRWRRGVELEDGKTLPAKVKLLRHEGDKTWLELTITEGRNQQVRRMGDATGFRVMRLARLAFAGIGTEGLAPGRWRYLTADEQTTLKKEYGVPKRIASPPKEEARTAKKPLARPAASSSRASRSRPAGSGVDARPRYGGGSPARRGLDVRDDWGGGIRRGSGGSRDTEEAPRADVGGRGGRTRTTGSGGGIGAGAGSYRVKGRRG